MKIKLLITGGTIDARYNYDKTRIGDMLQQGRSRVDVDLEQLMLADSGDITEERRHLILEKCNSADTDRIIVTHGTDTMVETARFLGKNIQDKIIVLVGSMIPYASL